MGIRQTYPVPPCLRETPLGNGLTEHAAADMLEARLTMGAIRVVRTQDKWPESGTSMRTYLRTLLVGGLLSLPFLGLGAGFILMGVDATVRGWAPLGKPKYDLSRTSTRTKDITRLYGPGAILAGASLCVGGLLVIPSGLIKDHGIGRQHWPNVVLLWKLVGVGTAVGFAVSICASITNVVW